MRCCVPITYFRPSAIINFLYFVGALDNTAQATLLQQSPVTNLRSPHNALAMLPSLLQR
jgi:hypothetical protein